MLPKDIYKSPYLSSVEIIKKYEAEGFDLTNTSSISVPSTTAALLDYIGYERFKPYLATLRSKEKKLPSKFCFEALTQRFAIDNIVSAIALPSSLSMEDELKASLSRCIGSRYGAHPYYKIEAFRNGDEMGKAISYALDTYKKSDSPIKKAYKQKYSSPELPPIWKMIPLFTFGGLVRFYGTLNRRMQEAVAIEFGLLSVEAFQSWLLASVELRNRCCHKNILFNWKFVKPVQKYKKANIPFRASHDSLAAMMQCQDFLHTSYRRSIVPSYPSATAFQEIRDAIFRYNPDFLPFYGFE